MPWSVLIALVVAAVAMLEIRRLERDPEQAFGATALRLSVGVLTAILAGLTVAEGSLAGTACALTVAALLIGPAVGRLLGQREAGRLDEEATVEIGAQVAKVRRAAARHGLPERLLAARHGLSDALVSARRWRLHH